MANSILSQMSSRDYEAVVIGGGHNGLICAAYLAKSGAKTLLLEARPEVGGCASTIEAMGASFNICNCDHILFRATNIAEELDLASFGLEYLIVDPLNLCLSWAGHKPWFLYQDIDKTLEGLAQSYPHQVEPYKKYCQVTAPMVKLMIEVARDIPSARSAVRAGYKTNFKGVKSLWQWSKMSAVEVLQSFFTEEALVMPALGLGPVVWGVDVTSKGTGLGALSYALRHAIGIGRPKGGSGALTSALKNCFLAHGGELRCAAFVDEIKISNSQRVVKLNSDEEITANALISAIDPRVAATRLLSPNADKSAQKKFLKRWQEVPQLDGFESKVDGLVSGLPAYKNVCAQEPERTDLYPTAIITPGLDDLSAGFKASLAGRTPKKPAMLVNFPSVRDNSMAKPKGSHILSLEVLNTPYAFEPGWGSSDEPMRWLNLYGSLIEGDFLDTLMNWRLMSPIDYETQFSMPKGYAPSFSGSPFAAIAGRPRELTRYTTPYDGLYFTGAGTFPGAGIWGTSGRNTAKVALKGL